jgi:hypothetical protein
MLLDVVIIVGCVVAALLFLFGVTRSAAAHQRKESNDFTGAVVAVIGTTYAVILAFMLSGVWSMSQQAQANEEKEANALVNIWRIGQQLPGGEGKAVENLCQKYAQNVVDKEWPAMQTMTTIPRGSDAVINQLWTVAGQSQAHSGPDAIAIYQLMEELRLLTEYRRIRLMHSEEELPGILRMVLIAGGIITVASSCLFGVPNFRFHVLQIAVLTFLLSLVLVAIADIDRPYQGVVRIEPQGFEYAEQTFTEDAK